MDCPVCREPMIVLEHEAIEVDYCLSCKGVWLDAGELELLFGDAAACAAFLDAGDAARAKGEKPRRCPVCRRKMEKGVTGGGAPVTYDRCPRGEGLWFDEGELAQVLKHGATDDRQGAVVGFLRDVFPDEAAR
ncbi:MAG TPA: zf-TFIIB domain-containing protein [Candidatus Hydrogenedentes bacterium]|nr:zf-TFIIB domain-containing protein [Candidatus Hydrogenedentota bacterium]